MASKTDRRTADRLSRNRAYQKNKDYMQYYSHTSEAKQLDEHRRPVRHRRVRKRKAVFRYIDNNKATISAYAIITIIIFFIGAFSVMSISASINNGRNDIIILNKNLKKIKEELQMLQADISNSLDLAQIEEVAMTRLDMSRPKSHQVVYISVPKQSYIIQHRTEDTSESRSVLSYVLGAIKSMLRLE